MSSKNFTLRNYNDLITEEDTSMNIKIDCGSFTLPKIKPIIFIDLDGTVYNLSEHVIKLYNLRHNTHHNPNTVSDYWWSNIDENKEVWKDILKAEGTFYLGNPIQNSIEVIDKLHQEGYEIFFVSLPHVDSQGKCFEEKLQWLQSHFDWVTYKHLIATGEKHLLARENRILIDDFPKYLIDFELYGGKGIGFRGAMYTDEFQGTKVDTWNEIYELIKSL